MSLRTQLSDIFHERTNYDFIGPTKKWFALSGTVILIGMAALFIRGLSTNEKWNQQGYERSQQPSFHGESLRRPVS